MEPAALEWAPILAAVRQGSEEASRTLVEALYPNVIRIVRAHLPVRQAEEDLAQEIFARIFSRLDRYESRPGIPFPHWVSRIALTTCLDALRAERRRPELRWADLSEDQATWLNYLATDSEAAPDTPAQQARELVEKLLAQLPPNDRLVLTLLDLEQHSVKEISQLTGWSAALVKVRAFRARRRLRRLAQELKSSAAYEEF